MSPTAPVTCRLDHADNWLQTAVMYRDPNLSERAMSGLVPTPGMDTVAIVLFSAIAFLVLWYFLHGDR